MHSSLLITTLLILPFVGAALALLVRRREGLAYSVAVAITAIETVLSLVVAFTYNSHVAAAQGFDFAVRHVFSAPLGLAYDVAIDGLSVWMVVLAAVTVLLALVGARDKRHEPTYVAWQLVLLGCTMGCFLAHDLLEFFLFFDLVLVPCYFLLTGWGGQARRAAAMKFFLYTFFGSAFLLVAVIYLGATHVHEFGGPLTFAYGALALTSTSHVVSVWLFAGFAVAFAVKAPIWPLHTWSPLAYEQAPVAAGVEMSALLSKLGTYGLLRFAVALLPAAQSTVRPVMLTLAVVSILYGALVACTAKNLRTFIAYSSLSQIGFMTLGVMSGSVIGTQGAVYLMVNHGLITIGVFLLVGYLERRGTFTLSELGGLQRPMPVYAGMFTVLMLATMGLPGLSGFVGEYLILIGTFATHVWWALAALVGVVASAVYWLWAYQRAFHGPVSTSNAELSDATVHERRVVLPIIALVVVLGVVPGPVLSRIGPSVHTLIAHVNPTGVTK